MEQPNKLKALHILSRFDLLVGSKAINMYNYSLFY